MSTAGIILNEIAASANLSSINIAEMVRYTGLAGLALFMIFGYFIPQMKSKDERINHLNDTLMQLLEKTTSVVKERMHGDSTIIGEIKELSIQQKEISNSLEKMQSAMTDVLLEIKSQKR